MSMWLVFKDFKVSKVKSIMAVVALATADFTYLLMYISEINNLFMFSSIFVLVVIALAATLLHLTKHVEYNVGVFKALGARSSTIAATFFAEVMLVGIIGSFVGIVIGVFSFIGLSFIASFKFMSYTSLLGIFLFLAAACVVGVLAGAIVGTCFTWKKSSKTVVETLTSAK